MIKSTLLFSTQTRMFLKNLGTIKYTTTMTIEEQITMECLKGTISWDTIRARLNDEDYLEQITDQTWLLPDVKSVTTLVIEHNAETNQFEYAICDDGYGFTELRNHKELSDLITSLKTHNTW